MDGRAEAWRWRLGKRTSQVDSRQAAFTEQTDYGIGLLQNAESSGATWRRRFFTCRPETADGFWVSGPTQLITATLITAPALRAFT